ncbi:MAG: hypothetical protein JO224_11290 [Pelomonas sp.]|nr:hypothetical protein [Roseateles sp.]
MRPALTHPVVPTVPSRCFDRLDRLKDPQVWVCAIAAFTLLGLSTGLLGGEPAQPRALTSASAAPVITVASAAPSTPVKP